MAGTVTGAACLETGSCGAFLSMTKVSDDHGTPLVRRPEEWASARVSMDAGGLNHEPFLSIYRTRPIPHRNLF